MSISMLAINMDMKPNKSFWDFLGFQLRGVYDSISSIQKSISTIQKKRCLYRRYRCLYRQYRKSISTIQKSLYRRYRKSISMLAINMDIDVYIDDIDFLYRRYRLSISTIQTSISSIQINFVGSTEPEKSQNDLFGFIQ